LIVTAARAFNPDKPAFRLGNQTIKIHSKTLSKIIECEKGLKKGMVQLFELPLNHAVKILEKNHFLLRAVFFSKMPHCKKQEYDNYLRC